MANKSLFASIAGLLLPRADARNDAGGLAYQLSPEQALAQFAATGCLNNTFYATAQTQLDTILALTQNVEPEFIARVALYTRSKSHMKDLPALLLAILSVRSPGLLAEVFDRVIDTPKMLRNFVQIMRSGVVGRKSLGTLPKRLVIQWLESRTDEQLFRASTGNSPSIADILKMVHPKPETSSRAALYGYLVGKPHDAAALPSLVTAFESFKAAPASFDAESMPDVPMDMLTALPLSEPHWKALAQKASWQTLRMNLNTFNRHGVFKDPSMIALAADKLRNAEQIARARVFPYQLLVAYMNAAPETAPEIKAALQDAMEIAIGNVPVINGKVWVLLDVSGSMQSAVTGSRAGSTSKVRCVDVAALFAAAILRRNSGAGIIPFADNVVAVDINPRDSIVTNAQRLASLPSGGTNCSAPLAQLNATGEKGDLLIFLSDNQSWVDSRGASALSHATRTMVEWRKFKRRNPNAKLVCLDILPGATTQAPENADGLNIGGFADSVFEVITGFNNGTASPGHWVDMIQKETI